MLASVICSTEESALAFVSACASEARAILTRHVDVLHALTDELLITRTLTGEEVDRNIASVIAKRQIAAEHERRRQWAQRVENAAAFQDESSHARASGVDAPYPQPMVRLLG